MPDPGGCSIRKKALSLTDRPHVVTGTAGNCRKPFTTQPTRDLHGKNIPRVPVPVHGEWRSSGTADGPDVITRYCSYTGELISGAGNIGTRHLAPTDAIPMQNEGFQRCFVSSAAAVSDGPGVV